MAKDKYFHMPDCAKMWLAREKETDKLCVVAYDPVCVFWDIYIYETDGTMHSTMMNNPPSILEKFELFKEISRDMLITIM